MSNFEEALERFHLNDLEYSGGLASHGTMGVEALEGLGHQALIPAFLDLYVPRLPPASPGVVLSPAEFPGARGDVERRADWVATFEALLLEGDWRAVVEAEVPALLPGLFASAGHGFLRTVHAIRSLERVDAALRRRELARGLALWAARFARLPGDPGSKAQDVGHAAGGRAADLRTAFEAWPLLGESQARAGLFIEAAERLDSFTAFAAAVETLPVPHASDVEEFLDSLCRIGAELYLAHPEARIAYVHALTLPSALRTLVPLLRPEDASRAALRVAQAVGALHSLFGERRAPESISPELEKATEDWAEIRYRAACSIQEHAIKMTEACWREDRHHPDRVFRLAAADAALHLEGTRSAGGC